MRATGHLPTFWLLWRILQQTFFWKGRVQSQLQDALSHPWSLRCWHLRIFRTSRSSRCYQPGDPRQGSRSHKEPVRKGNPARRRSPRRPKGPRFPKKPKTIADAKQRHPIACRPVTYLRKRRLSYQFPATNSTSTEGSQTWLHLVLQMGPILRSFLRRGLSLLPLICIKAAICLGAQIWPSLCSGPGHILSPSHLAKEADLLRLFSQSQCLQQVSLIWCLLIHPARSANCLSFSELFMSLQWPWIFGILAEVMICGGDPMPCTAGSMVWQSLR